MSQNVPPHPKILTSPPPPQNREEEEEEERPLSPTELRERVLSQVGGGAENWGGSQKLGGGGIRVGGP